MTQDGTMTSVIQNCPIPLTGGASLQLSVESGRSIIIIGANGAGKTRLGVHLENSLGAGVHRVAAQKSLLLNDTVQLISLERAENSLRFGYPDGTTDHKLGSRWGNRPVVHFLNDFDALLQTLFAEHNRVASEHLRQRKLDLNIPVPTTKLEKIKVIWDALLPHRKLELFEASIKVRPNTKDAATYSGSEMSDGERAIFYFLGQSFVAPANSALIVDEPESHIHKAIVGPLWDAVEKARPDCGFIYITHDLDFAVARTSAAKYFVRSYSPPQGTPESWEIFEMPDATGLPEYVIAELVGNRKPVLFVEGENGSIDVTIYSHVYSGFTVLPIGACDAVIHSVSSYNRSPALHHVSAKGVVDADDRGSGEVSALQAKGVNVLPVAEVENLLLLPAVFTELATALQCADPKAKLASLTAAVLATATREVDAVSARYTTRQLDRHLKKVTVTAKDLATLRSSYTAEIATIDPTVLYGKFKQRLEDFITKRDLAGVLSLYDNRGLLTLAAHTLDIKDSKALMEKVGRLLGNDVGKQLGVELRKVLPTIAA
jgi:hypothetical protein